MDFYGRRARVPQICRPFGISPADVLSLTGRSLQMRKLNRELRQWERIYDTGRLHQALGYLTRSSSCVTTHPNERNEKRHPSTGRVQLLDKVLFPL